MDFSQSSLENFAQVLNFLDYKADVLQLKFFLLCEENNLTYLLYDYSPEHILNRKEGPGELLFLLPTSLCHLIAYIREINRKILKMLKISKFVWVLQCNLQFIYHILIIHEVYK